MRKVVCSQQLRKRSTTRSWYLSIHLLPSRLLHTWVLMVAPHAGSIEEMRCPMPHSQSHSAGWCNCSWLGRAPKAGSLSPLMPFSPLPKGQAELKKAGDTGQQEDPVPRQIPHVTHCRWTRESYRSMSSTVQREGCPSFKSLHNIVP